MLLDAAGVACTSAAASGGVDGVRCSYCVRRFTDNFMVKAYGYSVSSDPVRDVKHAAVAAFAECWVVCTRALSRSRTP